MCYPSPGPRCSSSARLRLTKAKAAQRNNYTFDNTLTVREAEDDFFITPAGFRELKRLIANEEKTVEDLARYKSMRSERLAFIRSEDKGDLGHDSDAETAKVEAPKKSIPSTPLPGPDEVRKSWDDMDKKELSEREMSYIDDSAAWADKLTPSEVAAVRWMTSNGFHEMDQLARGEKFDVYYKDTETQEQKVERVTRMQKTLNRALRKAPDKARIVYRGISEHSTPVELLNRFPEDGPYTIRHRFANEEESMAAQTKYLDGLVAQGTISFDRPISASEDPDVGLRFAGGQFSPDFIYEISAKKGAAVAVMSAWGASEAEIVLPAKTKYRVVGYNQEAKISRNGDDFVTIIQLEEI